MARETVAFLANEVADEPRLEHLLTEFGWSLQAAATPDGLAELCARTDVLVVVVDPATVGLPWKEALSMVGQAAPRALPILCHRISDSIDWVEASAAGAFDLLDLPLNVDELRQTLGFAWAAKTSRFELIPMPRHTPRTSRKVAAKARGAASGNVA